MQLTVLVAVRLSYDHCCIMGQSVTCEILVHDIHRSVHFYTVTGFQVRGFTVANYTQSFMRNRPARRRSSECWDSTSSLADVVSPVTVQTTPVPPASLRPPASLPSSPAHHTTSLALPYTASRVNHRLQFTKLLQYVCTLRQT